jgi:hypothetical protein
MSHREKRLLLLFGCAGFFILNVLGFKTYQSKKLEYATRLTEARSKLQTAEMVNASRAQVAEDMAWLAEHEPEPAAGQDVQTKLQKFCDSEARSAGLTVKIQRPIATDATEGRHFHRSKFQFTLMGTEESLYRWLHRVNVPAEFRIATKIRLSPNKEDDTKIDCVAEVEQWFVPMPPTT